jgi:hypothetical protein
MTKDRVIYRGFSKAVNFVVRSINIVRKPSTFDSKSLDILNIEISWAQNHYLEER